MRWLTNTLLTKRFWASAPKYENKESTLSVTVVIPAWNEQEHIADTIESVLAQDYPIEVIVVDDCSDDDTAKIASSYDRVKVISARTRQGSKSQALNYALPYVDSDIFICVDSDTVLEKSSIRALIKAFNNRDVYIACGLVKNKKGKSFWELARRGEYVLGQYLCKCAQENANAVIVAAGCFFAVRTHYLKTRRFSSTTITEDMDLTWKAIEEGYDVCFVPEAKCYVSDPTSWKLYKSQLIRWYSGLFQNIKIREYNLFRFSPKLGIVVYSYVLLNLLGKLVAITALILMPSLLVYLVLGYILLLLVASISAIINKEREIIAYPVYLLASIIADLINYGLFLVAFYREIIVNQTLTIWVKGR